MSVLRCSAIFLLIASSHAAAQTALCVTERDCPAGNYCYQNRCFPQPGAAPAPAPAPVAAPAPPPPVAAQPVAAPPSTPPAAEAAPSVTAPAPKTEVVRSTGTAVERIRGRFGLGFLGTHLVPVGYGSPTGTGDMPGISPLGGGTSLQQTISVPTVGGLYWTQAAFGPVKAVGILIGVGMMSTGSGIQIEQPGQNQLSVSQPAVFGMTVHLGLPLAVSSGEHILISLAPEATFGFTTGIVRPSMGVTAPPAALSGSTIRFGARAAAEIFMGFIGLPEVSIEAGFRFGIAVDNSSIAVGAAKYTVNSTVLVTSLEGTPWNVFTSSIAARYYF